jgi:probable rRNA maturation factor
MPLTIHLSNKQKDLKIISKNIKALVKNFLSLEKTTCHEVSIHFVDEKTICQLHQQFFNDPSPTDCISLPMDDEDEPYRVLGEIFVCPKAAVDYAEKHQTDPQRELCLYVIHGLLHLIGYDDIDPKDRAKMRRAEKRHLDSFFTY